MRAPRLLPSKKPVTEFSNRELAFLAAGVTTGGNVRDYPPPRDHDIKMAIAAGILRERARCQ